MLVLAASPRSCWRREEFVVARTVFNGSNGIWTSTKPLPDSRANPYHIKRSHAKGNKNLRETAMAFCSLKPMQTLEEKERHLAGNMEEKGKWEPYIP